MKRFLKGLIFVFISLFVFTFASCKEEHVHKFFEEWEKDESGHWQVCRTCEEIRNIGDHTFGEWTNIEGQCKQSRVCSVCNFKETQTIDHTYVDGTCTNCKDNISVTQYFVRGTFNNWLDLPEYKFIYDVATNTSSVSVTLLEGDVFKVADSSYTLNHNFGYGNESLIFEEGLFNGVSEDINSDLVVLTSGKYKFVASELDKNFHKISITLECEHDFDEEADAEKQCHYILTCSKCGEVSNVVNHEFGDDITCDVCSEINIYQYYVRGNFSNNFAVHNDYLLTYDEETYSASITLNIFGGDAFKIATGDWSKEFNFYSAASPTGAFIPDDSGNFFSVCRGKFKFTVSGLNTLNHTITIEAIGDIIADEVHTNLPELYLRGSFSGVDWPALTENKFESVNGKLELVKELKVGDEFKIATGDWTTAEFNAANSKYDSTLFAAVGSDKPNFKVLVAGTYRFIVTNGFDGLACQIIKDGEELPEEDQGGSSTPLNPNDLYLVGSFNDWTSKVEYVLKYVNGAYTITVNFNANDVFKVKKGHLNWNEQYHYLSGQLNQQLFAKSGDNVEQPDIKVLKSGSYTLSISQQGVLSIVRNGDYVCTSENGKHTLVDATCEVAKHCSVEGCGYVEGEALGHDLDEGVVSNDVKVYSCKRTGCEYTKQVSVTQGNKIIVYFDISWDNIGSAYFNGVAMSASTDANGIYYIEIEADSITTMDLDFEQNGFWFHVVAQSATEYNSGSASIPVNLVKGKTYKVTNINWKSDDSNGVDKYYSCQVVEIL